MRVRNVLPELILVLSAMIAVIVAAEHSHASVSLVGDNPWKTLSAEVRAPLEKLLPRDADPLADADFAAWYTRYYCPKDHEASYCMPPRSVFAEFRYNSLELSERVSLACVIDRLRSDIPGFPESVAGLGRIDWVGGHAEVDFEMTGADSDDWETSAAMVRNFLIDKRLPNGRAEYTKGNGADWKKEWGLRMATPGPGLHIERRHADSSTINVHIDLMNPGAESQESGGSQTYNLTLGAVHYLHDQTWRGRFYTPSAILEASTNRCGVGMGDLLQAGVIQIGSLQTPQPDMGCGTR
ncbi:MAG: hypothetical protein ACXWP5_00500 [Bdellovibrionota bacterium]